MNNTDFHKRKIEAKKVTFEDLKNVELEIEEMFEEAKEFEKQRSHLEESDEDKIRDESGILKEDFEDYSKSEAEVRISTVKLKNPEKSIFKIRITNFYYIQVIVLDLSYLPVIAVGIWQVRNYEKM